MTDIILNIGLAFVLISAATMFASRINFSSIPFLIFLGMLFGPFGPELGSFSLKIVSHNESVEAFSRIGVLLLLFSLGLEFSAGKIAEAGKSLVKSGTVYVSLNFVRGLVFGWFFFHSWTEALVLAGITGFSSSAMVTKVLVDLKRVANPETELILGILVFEDIFIAVYLSILSGLLMAKSGGSWLILVNVAIILIFIISVITFGRRLGSFLEGKLRQKSSEAFVVLIFTMILLAGVLAEKIYVAEAIGALLLGLVLAETTHDQRILQMIAPMRDLFGALFFFSFGMGIDFRAFHQVAWVTIIAVLMTVVGNALAGYIASWLSGYRRRRAANVAFTIMARGEFSIIIAGLASAAGLNGKLSAMAALYVVLLSAISPALAKNTKIINDFLSQLGSRINKTEGTG